MDSRDPEAELPLSTEGLEPPIAEDAIKMGKSDLVQRRTEEGLVERESRRKWVDEDPEEEVGRERFKDVMLSPKDGQWALASHRLTDIFGLAHCISFLIRWLKTT